MIARLTVIDGPLTEYPLAEKVRGGWQNGVTFYPDENVTKVTELRVAVAHDESDAFEKARDALTATEEGDFGEALDWVDVLAIRLEALLADHIEYQEMAWRLSCLLDEQTGGLLSKTNYPVRVMSQQIDEYHNKLTEEEVAALGSTIAALDEYFAKLPTHIVYVPVPHLRNILAGRPWHRDAPQCICTPAIAGISDGPNVDCPEHGATPSDSAGE